MITLQDILIYTLLFGIPGFFAFILLFYPHKVIQWHAGEHRKFYKRLNMSDDDIDRIPQLPTDRALMGKKSNYINEASENPEKYPGLIVVCRFLGVFMAIMLVIAFIGVIFFFVSGAAYQ